MPEENPVAAGGTDEWPIIGWFGTRASCAVTGPTAELDTWLQPKGWQVDTGAHPGLDGRPVLVQLVHTGTAPEPIYLLAHPGQTLLWDGWHLKLASDLAEEGPDASEERSEPGWVDELVREMRRSLPPTGLLGLELVTDGRILELRYIRVSVGERGQGHAARILTRICAEADARKLVVACTPTDEFGADRDQLCAFYRRFGFAPVPQNDRLSEHTWERPAAARTTAHEEQ
ncbi:GNAT family N-acetyltransferase [Streptomyces sp. NPDC005962]|uniref:GNAT family N-acetyltransferase n=1 Tax=Streptomyces sp. NPDC005962 TaxID=3154466 RepID=UPI0033C7FAC9